MKCQHCQCEMQQITGTLRYTLLETMQAITLVNCEYFHCNRCDTVTYLENTKAFILEKIKQTNGNEKIVIEF